MLNFSAGELLFQGDLTGTPVLAYEAILRTEITRILTANGPVNVYHDDTGGDQSTVTQLIMALNQPGWGAESPGAGVFVRVGGQILVSGSGSVSIYGITQDIRHGTS